MSKKTYQTRISVRVNVAMREAIEQAASLKKISIPVYVRNALMRTLHDDGIRVHNANNQVRYDMMQKYSGDDLIKCTEASVIIGMTAEGLRRLLIRSGLGIKNTNGKWCVTAANLKAIKNSRDVVFGKEAA